MKVLVTGGSGFIGTVLIAQMLEDDRIEKIVNLDLSDSGLTHPKLQTIVADIRDLEPSGFSIDGDLDWCFHLAALCKEPGFEWDEYFETNDAGTANVIALCERLNIERIIFTSTMMVYRAGEIRRIDESQTAPDTAYGISKLLAEKRLEAWAARDSERTLKIVRPAVVFGKNENANFTRLYRSLKRGFFPYVGKSSTIKSNVYVKELVSFMLFLVDHPTAKTIFNLAFPTTYSMKRIVSEFKEVFHFRSFHPVLPMRPLLWASHLLEVANQMGLKNGIHHRRIEKLYYSTDVYPANALASGYVFQYDLRSALEDWKSSQDPNL